MADPIHQFEIQPIIPFAAGGLDLSYTNSALWMTIAAVVSITYFMISTRRKALVPGRGQAFSEMMYEFVAGMVRDNTGPKGRQYFPMIFTVFIVVLMGNVLGLIPYSFTYTSHIIVTFALAFVIFMMVTIFGIINNGFKFFSLFVPPGVPLPLLVLIVPIEILSFLIRPVTLSVRLFANMVAGHILLKVFAGFGASLLIALGGAGLAIGIVPMLFNVAIYGLELLVAFLQAYIFAILSAIYLKDTVDLHH